MEFGDISGITGYASSIAQSAGASKMAGQAKAASTDDELMEVTPENIRMRKADLVKIR